MLKVYNTMRGRFKTFETYRQKPITFECLDLNFYDEFVDYFTYIYVQRRRKHPIVGLKLASIGHAIKQLRIFIRDRVRRKIIPPIDLTDFKILDEEADAIYLTALFSQHFLGFLGGQFLWIDFVVHELNRFSDREYYIAHNTYFFIRSCFMHG